MSEMSHGTGTGSPYKIYLVTWGILLVLTVLMLGTEKLPMGRWVLLGLLLLFMMVKATYIAGNFMHLKFEKRNLAVVVAAGLIVTSLILFAFITPESHHIVEKSTYKAAPVAEAGEHH
jgi:cytochrome c oxidase subunit IV